MDKSESVLGRKNCVNIFSKEGAAASSIHYSIIETIKTNNLRVYDYMEYLISELVAHQDDTNLDFLQNLLPWSKTIQEKFHTSTNP